jgi:LPXTG-motif cell wall-anchored protein
MDAAQAVVTLVGLLLVGGVLLFFFGSERRV